MTAPAGPTRPGHDLEEPADMASEAAKAIAQERREEQQRRVLALIEEHIDRLARIEAKLDELLKPLPPAEQSAPARTTAAGKGK